MNPYYESDGITIYHGDGSEVVNELGDDVFDCCICDPPFSSGARQDAGKAMRGAMVRGQRWQENWFSRDNLATVGFIYMMRFFATSLFESAKDNASVHLFIDWRMYPHLYGSFESAGWIAKNLLVWDKQHFGMGTTYRNQHELILYAEKGSIEFSDRGLGNVIQCPRADCVFHPTEKPLPLLEKMILATTNEGDTVIDPCCGSGSTLRAAKNTGRSAIGIEIEERFCEISANRLRQGVLEFNE